MIYFLRNLFSMDFMPHGHCYFWRPGVLWLNVGSDTAIALAYYSIPLALYVFVRRRQDLAFRSVFFLFMAFIFACGGTHLLEAVTVWKPVYRFEGLVKLVTAIVSGATAIVLWKLLPHALTLPSPAQLQRANEDLQREVRDRQTAQAQLETLNTELERRVTDRTEELRRSNEDLEQFAYVASHDLQEPLRAVTMYVELLERRYGEALDADAHKYIAYASGGAKRMRELIRDLLSYSRASTGQQEVQVVDANLPFERAVRNVRESLESIGGEIVRSPLPQVHADKTQLAQIFQNLLSNAVKYHSERPLKIEVSAEADGDGAVTFRVCDNGIGIDPEYAKQIFEPFRRLHTRETYPGSGLGLSICKRLVERHGGRLWVESTPGEGSTFFFRFPAG